MLAVKVSLGKHVRKAWGQERITPGQKGEKLEMRWEEAKPEPGGREKEFLRRLGNDISSYGHLKNSV